MKRHPTGITHDRMRPSCRPIVSSNGSTAEMSGDNLKRTRCERPHTTTCMDERDKQEQWEQTTSITTRRHRPLRLLQPRACCHPTRVYSTRWIRRTMTIHTVLRKVITTTSATIRRTENTHSRWTTFHHLNQNDRGGKMMTRNGNAYHETVILSCA
jgi:hypothetical protein